MQISYSEAINAAEKSSERFFLNVSSRFSGLQGGGKYGRNTGSSLEYMDHREYQPGDDVRHIDWNALARSDKLTVKLFREEITPHLDILIDCSRSMDADDTFKAECSVGLANLLRNAAVNSGFSANIWLIKETCKKIIPATLNFSQWPDARFDYTGNPGRTLVDRPPELKTNGVRILLSDLFWDSSPMSVIQAIGGSASLLVIVQTLAEIELNPQIHGNVRLIDCETGDTAEMMANANLLEKYRENFLRHQQFWKECCSKTGVVFCDCMVEELALNGFVPESLLASEILATRS